MATKRVKEILEEAKQYSSLSNFDKRQLKQEKRYLAVEAHVKDVAHNACALQYFMMRNQYREIQAIMIVFGLLLSGGLYALNIAVDNAMPIMLSSHLLAIKLLFTRFTYNRVRKLTKDRNIVHFCKFFRPALKRSKRRTKWLRPAEICALIEKKAGKKISPKDMGIALTKICVKSHQKYLVQCI